MHHYSVAMYLNGHSTLCSLIAFLVGSGVLSGVETIIPVVRPLRNVNNFRSPGVNAEEGEEEEEGSLNSVDECIC